MGFLRDHKDHKSSMRLIAIASFIVAAFIAIWGAVTNTPDTGLVGLFLGSSITGKVAQKYVELGKDNSNEQ